jgi:glycosyltransferase involved in cell wall biosynthesis
VVGVAVGYLSVLTAAAWLGRAKGKHRTALPPAPRHRFTVLIPAHNEERLIGATLQSLAELDYPEELVSVHVVADHCTDGTAAVVRAHGVSVDEHDDPYPAGKGPALQRLLHRLSLQRELGDAVVFIDADTTVSRDFLRIVDAHLAAGAAVVQAQYAVRDPEQAPAIAFRSAALAARHYLRPLGRAWLGGSAGLYGNGMVFRTEVLDGRRWSDHLTEDIELHLYADAAAEQLIPPFSVLVLATGAVAAAAVARAWSSPSPRARRGVLFAGGLAAAQTAYLLSALHMVDAPASVYRSLLRSPRFVVWKVRLWLEVLTRRRDVRWVRTTRNPEVEAA